MGESRRTVARRATIEQRIRDAVAEVRPLLRLDDAVIELREFDPETGVAVLALAGECPHCHLSATTFMPGVEAHVRRLVPDVREVRLAAAS